jgi:ADP-ribosylglycohydrolase
VTRERARGALHGLAVGDALGMPTESTSRAQIVERYGVLVDRFHPAPPGHSLAAGLPAGSVTDDTEQAALLGWLMVESGGRIDPRELGRRLVAWEASMRERGSIGLLGPSTKRALAALAAGVDPAEAGRSGTTNGAAMRIAPVGIMMPPEPLDALVAKVAETCRATHNTSIAIASAAAVAAAVSRGVAGGGWHAASDSAVAAARRGATLGHWVTGGDIAARIVWAQDIVRGKAAKDAIRLITDLVGTGVASQESVPAAFAVLEVAGGDAWQAAVISANLGGDTDTIGAIASGMAGACVGFSRLPQQHIARLVGIDIGEVRALAGDLAAARTARASKDAAA